MLADVLFTLDLRNFEGAAIILGVEVEEGDGEVGHAIAEPAQEHVEVDHPLIESIVTYLLHQRRVVVLSR